MQTLFTLTVVKQSQTISFTSSPPGGATLGGPSYTVAATATSGLAVTFSMADPQPLPESPEGVVVDDEACGVLARAAGRVSTTLASAPITRRQARYRPVTDEGLPLIGHVPGVKNAYVAMGHGPWGMLNVPATGFALAELIVSGAATTIDLRAFDPRRS